ncbi:MAG: hypothetical protein GXP63_02360 [DPANN group archaeon]|nr:hypothetical protein [DPANN group archaeon]
MKFKFFKDLKDRAEKFATRVQVDETGFYYIRKGVAESSPDFYENERKRRLKEKKRKLQEAIKKLEEEVK